MACLLIQWMKKRERLIETQRKNSQTVDFTTTSDREYIYTLSRFLTNS